MASMYSTMQFAAVQRSYRFPSISSAASGVVKNGLFSSKAKHLELCSLPEGLSGKPLKLSGVQLLKKHDLFQFPVTKAAAADADGQEIEISSGPTKSFAERFPALVTGFFFFTWYFLNVIFNILNKKVYNYFPYPYFVSVVHLLVGVVYCIASWSVGLPKRAPIDKELLLLLTPVAICHALGHVMSNVSFAAVAVSFTHTIKALEPFFNAAASQFVLGHQIPLSLWLSLAPVVIGVSMASLTELSFNWTGFISAMISNIAFTYRSIYSKKAMTGMDSTNVYAYISIIALLFCLPPAIFIEGPQLMQYGFRDAIAKVGLHKFLSDLFWIGMFYHLYNQVATNTLERVAPLTHAVGNVLKRVFVIGFSIVVFGNKISTQTGIGTAIAIAGVAIYSLIKANIEEKKREYKVHVKRLPYQKFSIPYKLIYPHRHFRRLHIHMHANIARIYWPRIKVTDTSWKRIGLKISSTWAFENDFVNSIQNKLLVFLSFLGHNGRFSQQVLASL